MLSALFNKLNDFVLENERARAILPAIMNYITADVFPNKRWVFAGLPGGLRTIRLDMVHKDGKKTRITAANFKKMITVFENAGLHSIFFDSLLRGSKELAEPALSYPQAVFLIKNAWRLRKAMNCAFRHEPPRLLPRWVME